MKTPLSSLLVLLFSAITLSAAASAAPSTKSEAVAYSVRLVDFDQNGTTISRGTTQTTVVRLLGTSYRKIADNTWLYQGYQSSHSQANQQGCHALVFTFASGKVADIKIVNQNASQLIARNVQVKPSGTVVAAR